MHPAARRVSFAVEFRPEWQRETERLPGVLLVSQDPDLRDVVSRVLRTAGYRVTATAHGGHAVLACLREAPFGVLIVDGDPAEGSARELAARLRRYCPELHLVRIGRPEAVSPDYDLKRPFTADDLLAVLTTLSSAF